MMKALGLSEGAPLLMTDEAGQLVGFGNGSAGMLRSIPIIEAIRSAPLAKSLTENTPMVEQKILLTQKPGSNTAFLKLHKELASLRKSMTTKVTEDGDDDIWSVVAGLDAQLSAIEATLKRYLV